MQQLHQLEVTAAGWFKAFPHLPKNAQQWLATNVWWIALIGVILSILSLFTVIPAFLLALGITSFMPASYSYGYGIGTLYWLIVLVSVIGLVMTTVLLGMAVSPLKSLSKRGWNLLFMTLVVKLAFGLLSTILSVVFMFDTFRIMALFSGILGVILSGIVGGYFVFEIRGEFSKKKALDKKVAAKA